MGKAITLEKPKSILADFLELFFRKRSASIAKTPEEAAVLEAAAVAIVCSEDEFLDIEDQYERSSTGTSLKAPSP